MQTKFATGLASTFALALTIAACSGPATSTMPAGHGRYAGVGVFPAGSMWQAMQTHDASALGVAARLGDDEYIIVVNDSVTGELRQCGNLSGYCIRMNPWARSDLPSSPVAMTSHASQRQTGFEPAKASQRK